MVNPNLAGKRVALYARYSTNLQSDASVEDQLRGCRKFVLDRGGSIDPNLVFSDRGVSGASCNRPGFERMMNLVLVAHAVDVIVVEDLSRLSRDLADSTLIFKQLQFLNVPLLGVSDGIDTSSPNAKVSFVVKSLLSDMYLDDLRGKTLRGLEGRALNGFSTGGLPLGYRSVPERAPDGRGYVHRIEVDPVTSQVVRRIFELYKDGMSHPAIAGLMTKEGVPCARAHTGHKYKGWGASSVRGILMNPAYIGEWSFKKKEWRKEPVTGRRRHIARTEAEIVRRTYPERRIVDQAVWEAVKARLAEVRATYRPSERGGVATGASGRNNNYVLSGLLRCGLCGEPMSVCRGTSAAYYRCTSNRKRKVCPNSLSLREDVARTRILDAVWARLANHEAMAILEKKVGEYLAVDAAGASSGLLAARKNLRELDAKIARLVTFIVEHDESESVRAALQTLELEARQERAKIETIMANTKDAKVPTAKEVIARGLSLRAIAETEPVRFREAFAKLFEKGGLRLVPQPGGYYAAESRLFPLAVLSFEEATGGTKTGSPAVKSCPRN